MKKKTIIGTVLTLSFLIVAVFATAAPTLAYKPNKNTIFSGALAEINIQLPSNSSPPAPPGGNANHPTMLKIAAWDFDRRSTNGAADEILLFIWSPAENSLEPVAQITDNAANAAFWKIVWNNTYLWYPFILPPPYPPIATNLFPNVIQVGPKDLEVWTESTWTNYGHNWNVASDTLMVNLTKPITVTLPYFQVATNPDGSEVEINQTFTLPPMTLMFKATSDAFNDPFAVSLNFYPGSSNYTLVRTGESQFAGARVDITDWLGFGFRYEGTGHVYWHETDTYIPPP
jgi:hypothetical protein